MNSVKEIWEAEVLFANAILAKGGGKMDAYIFTTRKIPDAKAGHL